MFSRIICILVAATILAFTSAEEQDLRAGKPSISFPQGSVLKFGDAMIRKFSNDAVGIHTNSAFRNSDGELRKIEPSIKYADSARDAVLQSITPCPVNPGATSIYYGASSFTDGQATLSYTYATPLPTFGSTITENFCLTLTGTLSAINMNFDVSY